MMEALSVNEVYVHGCNKYMSENVSSPSRVSEACTEDMGARFSER